MSTDAFAELPPELISLLPPTLLHVILQPELEARITPELGKELLFWAADSKTAHHMTPLHVAAEAGNTGIVALLLDAGADPAARWDQDEYQPLHSAVRNNDLPTVRLLLDRGANIDAKYGCDGWSLLPLHEACRCGYLEMVSLLLERGANMELRGHNGTALGFALHEREMDVIKLLLLKVQRRRSLYRSTVDGCVVALHSRTRPTCYIVRSRRRRREGRSAIALPQKQQKRSSWRSSRRDSKKRRPSLGM
ncbi:ankyrin repeat-containing domain protein [Mycena olivaceomarginata]|nr:ankyrin repeat-containing domain protein [Mycena olivaceomarginata]